MQRVSIAHYCCRTQQKFQTMFVMTRSSYHIFQKVNLHLTGVLVLFSASCGGPAPPPRTLRPLIQTCFHPQATEFHQAHKHQCLEQPKTTKKRVLLHLKLLETCGFWYRILKESNCNGKTCVKENVYRLPSKDPSPSLHQTAKPLECWIMRVAL